MIALRIILAASFQFYSIILLYNVINIGYPKYELVKFSTSIAICFSLVLKVILSFL